MARMDINSSNNATQVTRRWAASFIFGHPTLAGHGVQASAHHPQRPNSYFRQPRQTHAKHATQTSLAFALAIHDVTLFSGAAVRPKVIRSWGLASLLWRWKQHSS
jgi:hypothetical protein